MITLRPVSELRAFRGQVASPSVQRKEAHGKEACRCGAALAGVQGAPVGASACLASSLHRVAGFVAFQQVNADSDRAIQHGIDGDLIRARTRKSGFDHVGDLHEVFEGVALIDGGKSCIQLRHVSREALRDYFDGVAHEILVSHLNPRVKDRTALPMSLMYAIKHGTSSAAR